MFWPAVDGDRYMYIPQIGLFLAIVWTVPYLVGDRRETRVACRHIAAIILIFAAVAHAQVRYWTDSVSLFQHAAAVTSDNKLAHLHVGGGLLERGDYEGAEREYRQAEGFKPPSAVYVGWHSLFQDRGKSTPLPTLRDARLKRALTTRTRGRTSDTSSWRVARTMQHNALSFAL